MRFKVRAQWRRQDGTVVGVADDVAAGDACEALLSAWPTDADRPCSAVTITIEPIRTAIKEVPSAAQDDTRPADEHAAALLDRLRSEAAQLEPSARGHVSMAYPAVLNAYNDVIARLGWQPAPWTRVSRALRRLTNGRKRYVNAGGGKLVVYDIPLS